MTGYGFTGPMTARGTVFSDKTVSSGGSGTQSPRSSRYQLGYNARFRYHVWFVWFGF